MAGQLEALLQDTHGLSYARVLLEDFPDTRLRQVCLPRLPKELVWGLRLAAARLFKASTLVSFAEALSPATEDAQSKPYHVCASMSQCVPYQAPARVCHVCQRVT